MTRSEIERTFNINTFGVIRLTQAVLPHMKRRKNGRIITVTSNAGRVGEMWNYLHKDIPNPLLFLQYVVMKYCCLVIHEKIKH